MRFDVPREIRTDDVPRFAAIGRLKDDVTAEPADVSVPGRECDGRIPIEAIRHRAEIEWPEKASGKGIVGTDEAAYFGRTVEDRDRAVLEIRPDIARIDGSGTVHTPSPPTTSIQ